MRRFIRRSLGAAVLLAVTPGVAVAGGGHNAIPCLYDTVIKVVNVPPIEAEALAQQWGYNVRRIRPGSGLALGYRYAHCQRAGWVGYIGYRDTFFDLSAGQLTALVKLAGMDELPPEPGPWHNPELPGLFGGLFFAALYLVVRGRAAR